MNKSVFNVLLYTAHAEPVRQVFELKTTHLQQKKKRAKRCTWK